MSVPWIVVAAIRCAGPRHSLRVASGAPSCGQAYPVVKRLQRHFGKRLLFVSNNFPLDLEASPRSCLAARRIGEKSFRHAFEPILLAESAAASTERPDSSSVAVDMVARTISTLYENKEAGSG